MADLGTGLRLSGTGIAANLILAVTKILTGIYGHSNALVADGVESTADIFGSMIVWGGLRISALPPDEKHPFGHGKAEPVAGVLVALALLVAAGFIAVHSVREILRPHHLPEWYTLVVLGVVIVIKEWLFRAVNAASEDLGSTALRGEAWHHRSDAITSAAVFVGILVARACGPGYESADDWAALLACGVIVWNGFRLLSSATDEIMDASPGGAVVGNVRDRAAAVPGVAGVGRVRVRKSGMGLLVDIHVKVPGSMSVQHGHAVAHAVEDALSGKDLRVCYVSVHIEPAADPT
jgi:cation diffusion facilitator family transporter